MELRMSSHLSPARFKLLEILRCLGFGVIEDLAIVNGEPCFDPFPRILEDIKIGSESESRPSTKSGAFALTSRMIELLDHLDRLGSGKVRIEVKHSQAFRIVVEHTGERLLGKSKGEGSVRG